MAKFKDTIYPSKSAIKDAVRDLPDNVFLHAFRLEGSDKTDGYIFGSQEDFDARKSTILSVSNICYTNDGIGKSIIPNSDDDGYPLNIERRRYPRIFGFLPTMEGIEIAMNVKETTKRKIPY